MGVYGIGNHGQNGMYGNILGDVPASGRKETAGKAEAGHAGSMKFMDRVEKGECVNLLKECRDGVTVEVSGAGMEELKKMAEIKNENPGMRILSGEEKLELLKKELKPAQRLHRIIPNIQTNDKLEKSLKGAGRNTVEAAYTIIEKNFLPHNIGSMTEQERRELIAVGLEQAQYLAGGMDAGKAELFMDAMTTVAKYGVNGKTDTLGNVKYDIRWGAMAGAPDDYISTGEMMRRLAPEQYKTYSAMLEEGFAKKDDRLVGDALKHLIGWESESYRKNPERFEEEKKKQAEWKKGVENTKIESAYRNTDKTDIGFFTDSIMGQSRFLDRDFLLRNLREFADILAGGDDFPWKWQ